MDLKEKLIDLLENDDAISVNHYFGFNFWDEYPDEDEDILDFLSETFYDIEMLWVDDKDIENPVKKALKAAIQMIEKKEQGVKFVSLKMNLDDYLTISKLLPDVCPDVSFFLKEADHNLVKLGLCKSAPCVAMFILDNNQFNEMLDDLNDIEFEAFNTPHGVYPSESNPAYRKYLKYGCLYDILSNAEII